MKKIAFAAAALCAVSFTSARAQTAYEIVHAGDGQMSCDAMAKEIAGLGAEIQTGRAAAQQQQVAAAQAADRSRMVRGIGGAMFSQAAAFGIGRLPMGALISNPTLMSGLVHAAAASSEAISNGVAPTAQAATVSGAASLGPEQRQAYMISLFKSKSC